MADTRAIWWEYGEQDHVSTDLKSKKTLESNNIDVLDLVVSGVETNNILTIISKLKRQWREAARSATNKKEARDFETMMIAAVHIEAAIEALPPMHERKE